MAETGNQVAPRLLAQVASTGGDVNRDVVSWERVWYNDYVTVTCDISRVYSMSDQVLSLNTAHQKINSRNFGLIIQVVLYHDACFTSFGLH